MHFRIRENAPTRDAHGRRYGPTFDLLRQDGPGWRFVAAFGDREAAEAARIAHQRAWAMSNQWRIAA
ncbi:MAG: hypothetical protein ACK4TR_08805 [Phenylobacterium sp.]|uniref:hypothetical protein n=1 Tax=Phenylobacterium sp. TaxID=1871053 RepID=UPI00391CF449